MTRDQFCNQSTEPVHDSLTVENANVMEAGTEAGILSKCKAMPKNIGGWLFLLIMTSIILLLEGNNVYRVSSTCQVLC